MCLAVVFYRLHETHQNMKETDTWEISHGDHEVRVKTTIPQCQRIALKFYKFLHNQWLVWVYFKNIWHETTKRCDAIAALKDSNFWRFSQTTFVYK